MNVRRWILAVVCGVAAACSEPTTVIPPSFAGEWNYRFFVSAGPEDGCGPVDGTLVLTQTGVMLTGTSQKYTGSCFVMGEVVDSGSITDSLVTIHAGSCTLTAPLGGASPDSVSGDATCQTPGFTWVGTWNAARAGAAASIELLPGDVGVVAGAALPMQAVIRDADGRVLNGRTVTWVSSTLGVATVTVGTDSRSATLNALTNGSTVVSATSGSLLANIDVDVSSPSFVEVRGGGGFSCARTAAGAVWCWGESFLVQPNLGNYVTSPVRLSSPVPFASITLGAAHGCGLTAAGAAWCWGANRVGQVGAGDTISGLGPRAVTGGHVFVQIDAGTTTTCGLKASGEAWCWGAGPIGDGSTQASIVPKLVGGSHVFTSIASWSDHICGTTATTGYCWGANSYGEIGRGDTGSVVATPTAIIGGLSFTALSPSGISTCGVDGSGLAHCWGNDVYGTLGDSAYAVFQTSPVQVFGAQTYAAITSGYSHTCALTGAGQLWCWGSNTGGALGDLTQVQRNTPVAVAGGLVFTQVSAGGGHTCGMAGGVVYCWGYNQFGAAGNGTTTSFLTTPTRVLGQP